MKEYATSPRICEIFLIIPFYLSQRRQDEAPVILSNMSINSAEAVSLQGWAKKESSDL